MKIKKPKNLKPNFSGFLGFKKTLKNLGFLKWVSTALIKSTVLNSIDLELGTGRMPYSDKQFYYKAFIVQLYFDERFSGCWFAMEMYENVLHQ